MATPRTCPAHRTPNLCLLGTYSRIRPKVRHLKLEKQSVECVVCVVSCMWCGVWCVVGLSRVSVEKPPCVDAKRLRVYTRRHFESITHTTHTTHVTHTTIPPHSRISPPIIKHVCLPTISMNHYPWHAKKPKWAMSPILLFQRQSLHHKLMHVRLSTHKHNTYTHMQTHTHTHTHTHST